MPYDHVALQRVKQKLEAPVIPESLTVGDETTYLFALVTDDCADELILTMDAQGADPQWGYREWLEEAMFYPKFAVSVRKPGDAAPSGFLVFDTHVFISPETGQIALILEVVSVYVAPGARGKGYGDAFASLLADQLLQTLDRIATAQCGSLMDLPRLSVELAMKAYCVSEEGARFVRKAVDTCRTAAMERSYLKDGLSVSSTVDDRVDYGDWDDEPGLHP